MCSIMLDTRYILTAQYQARRTIIALNRCHPSDSSLSRIRRAPNIHARNITQTGCVLYRLVCRAIFALADGVVSQHRNGALLHQRSHTQRALGVVGEHVESSAERQQAAMQSHTVHDGKHTKLTNSVRNVVTGLFTAHVFKCTTARQVGAGQVSRTTQELRQYRCQRCDYVL